jgi:predicted DCC family thiol-disulfide oxidoreductase YuxK
MADMLAPDARLRGMNTPPAPRPVLVFDGDCGFCTTTARLLQRLVERGGRDFAVAPWQELDLEALGLTAQSCLTAAQWVSHDGTVRAGHLSIAAALRAGRPVWRPVGVVLTLPGISALAAWAYRWVADHRYALPGGTQACGLPSGDGDGRTAA